MKFLWSSGLLFLGACTYDFAGVGGSSGTTEPPGTTSASSTVGNTATATTADAPTSVGSVSTGTLPDELPPCGDFVDTFDGPELMPDRWSALINEGDISVGGELVLEVADVPGAFAGAELLRELVVPCAFTVALASPGDDDVRLDVPSADGLAAVGLVYESDGSMLTGYTDQAAGQPKTIDGAEALGMILLPGRVVLLAHARGVWEHVMTADTSGWSGLGRPAVLNTEPNRTVAVDDYGIVLVEAKDVP